MKISNVFLIFTAVLVFSSCAKQIVRVEGDTKNLKRMESIVLAEVVIGPPKLPVIPPIDAGIYNAAFNSNAEVYIDMHKSNVSGITDAIGSAIQTASGAACIYGENLLNNVGYKNLDLKEYSVMIANDHFQNAIIQDGIINIIDFGDNSTLDNFIDTVSPNVDNLVKIANSLNADGVVLAIVSVPTVNVGTFGIMGNKMAQLTLYYFDNTGKYVGKGFGSTKPTSGGPGKLEHYELTMLSVKDLSKELAQTIYSEGE